jgi:hypothetical protein
MAARAGFVGRFFVLALGCTGVAAACSPAATNTDGNNGNATGATGGGAGTTSQPSGTGNATSSGSSGGGGTVDPGAGGGSILGPGMTRPDPNKGDGPDGSCSGTSATAEQTVVTKTMTTVSPVALYLVQDRSGSMRDTPNGASQNKWTQATDAVNAFMTDPKSANLDVALGFFPIDTGQCDGTNYNMPKVPMARLPSQMQAMAVASAITANAPGGGGGGFGNPGASGTPIEGALRGGENFCMVYQAQNPTEKCVVVLITDGAPNGCAGDAATLTKIVKDASDMQHVMTFAIGMDGADFNLLDQIATAGGSSCGATPACNVNNGTTSFNDALDKIRTTVVTTMMVVQKTTLACQYNIPPPKNGQTLDPSKVNVQITKDGATQKVFQVKDAADCANFGNAGWYYDPMNPSTVKFCPSTCGSVETPDGGVPVGTTPPRVDLLFGCKTEMAIPA